MRSKGQLTVAMMCSCSASPKKPSARFSRLLRASTIVGGAFHEQPFGVLQNHDPSAPAMVILAFLQPEVCHGGVGE